VNYQQIKAVESDAQRLVLLAGAGTGKTYTLLERTVYLLKKGYQPEELLVLTFTRHAAAEFNSRFAKLWDGFSPHKKLKDRPIALTYHGFALNEISKNPRAFKLNFSSIYDPVQARKTFIQTCDKVKRLYPDVDTPAPEILFTARHLAICNGDPGEVFKKFPGAESYINGVLDDFEAIKRGYGLAEFDDIILSFYHRLKEDPTYAETLRNKIKHLMIDEFQDNNRLQDSIVRAIDPDNICLVGDPNQSIYSWRGSDPKIMAEWMRSPGVKTLALDLNYRSGPHILSLANNIMRKVKDGVTLRPTKTSSEQVQEFVAHDPVEESAECLKWFLRPLGKGQTRAVIGRTSFELEILQRKLDDLGIRYSRLLKEDGEMEESSVFLNALCRLATFPSDHGSYYRIALALCGSQKAAKLIGWFRKTHQAEFPGPMANVPRVLAKLSNGDPGAADEAIDLAKFAARCGFSVKQDNLNKIAAEFKENFSQAQTARMYMLGEFGARKRIEPLAISTIHSAKGLEWNEVWLIGVGASQLPHPKAKAEGRIDEERRLAFVGVTRAQDTMVISYPKKIRGRSQKGSPFISSSARAVR
jgi:DNA helicase-2/ATP-dependent DNA helicase PcrA